MSNAMDEDSQKPIEVREPAITVLEAELATSSPGRVLQWLEARAAAEKSSTPEFDEQIEKTLLARQDPLINLGIARCGIDEETVRALFDSADLVHRRALRLAVLSNQAVHKHRGYRSGDLIEALIGYEANVGEWLASLSNEEIRALFLNPTLGDNFLIDFLEQKKGWQELDERQHLFVLKTLAKNPRMLSGYVSVIMDGYAEYKHGAVFNAAWTLELSAPVTIPWCWALQGLYSNTAPVAFTIKDPLEVSKRWVPDSTDAQLQEAEQEMLDDGYLGPYAQLRQQLARLVLGRSGRGGDLQKVLVHDDLAVRMAGSRYGDLTAAQMEAVVVRDPTFAFRELVANERLWRRAATREMLRKMAWEQPDPKSHMDAPNMYRYFEAELREKYPAWFEDEDQEPVDEDTLPVTRGEFKQAIADLTEKVELTYPTLGTTQSNVLSILGRTGWLGWGLVVALVILMIEVLGKVVR